MESLRLFREAEVRAERIIGVLRVIVALSLAIIFFLAVIRLAPDIADPVVLRQIVLAVGTMLAYLALGIVSFALAAAGRLSPWMFWLFAAGDVGFVLVSLGIGLSNADVESNFLVAMPAAWLIPMVLAFGALRYDPRLQGLIAVGLVGGLLALAALSGFDFNLAGSAPPEALTFFFGPPPNVMRLAMVALAGAVLVIAAGRTRALLQQAIADALRRANLTRYLPPQIADWLAETSAEQARRGRRQPAAVLFVDVRGFTERAERLAPDDIGRFIGEFRRCVAAAVGPHGGVIDKFIGDSVMVVFGVPNPGPNNAADALAAARAILAAIGAWNAERRAADPVQVGIGLHCGEVYCGAIGDDDRLEFTVLGDTVNVAARLEQESKTASAPLLVSEELLNAAGEAPGNGWRALPPHTLRGRQRPIRLYALNLPPAA